MLAADYIEVRSGPPRWYRGLHLVILGLAGAAAWTSPTDLHWKIGLLVAVAAAFAWNGWLLRHPQSLLCLRLYRDGTAAFVTGGATGERLRQLPHCWVTRALCVVPLGHSDGSSRRHPLIFSSCNRSEDYRRLMLWLRLRDCSATGRRMVL